MVKAVEGYVRGVNTSEEATIVIQGRKKSGDMDRERPLKVIETTSYPAMKGAE